MRAWHVTAHGEPADVLRLVDVEEPEPLPGHVRVRVEAAAIGLPDVFMCRNTYAFQPPLPAIVGQEVRTALEGATGWLAGTFRWTAIQTGLRITFGLTLWLGFVLEGWLRPPPAS